MAKFLFIFFLIFISSEVFAYGLSNRVNARIHFLGGKEINKFDVEDNGKSNFDGSVFGTAFEIKTTSVPYSFGILLEYKKSSVDNTANNSTTTEIFDHTSYRAGARLYAVDIMLGAHIIYMESELRAKNSGLSTLSSYKGLGYGFDIGYEFNFFTYLKFIPAAYYTYVELNGDNNNIGRDGIVYGLTTSLVIEF